MHARRSIALGLAGTLLIFAGVAWADGFDPEDGTDLPTLPDEKGYEVKAKPDSAAQPGEKKPGPKLTERNAERMVEYFLSMYDKHLESRDWVHRAITVISLGRINDPRTTDRLLKVLAEDSRRVVRVFAWEALHARNGSLSAEQRKQWLEQGRELARQGAFGGDLRIGLVGLLTEAGPGPEGRRTFLKLFARTNSLDPGDIATLDAMSRLLATWKDPDLIKALITEMGKLDNAYRAEYVLGGLGAGVPPAVGLAEKGSKFMWTQTQQAWANWFTGANLAAADAKRLGKYQGRSRLLPAPHKITNSRDPRWRKDLELGRFYLDQLDVCFCVDSTGSMTEVVAWIKRDVAKMMRAFGMISREPRIGIIFYRDHGDEYVVKGYPLTDNGGVLAKAISSVTAKGGGDVPEAVYDALAAAVRRPRWSGGDRAKKVIVLVGDAEPKEGTTGKIQSLVAGAAKKGFRFYCVKAQTRYGSPNLASFDQIAAAGKGKAIWVDFPAGQPITAATRGRTGVAYARQEDSPYRQIVGAVLGSMLAETYRDRAQPFVTVLLEYLERPVREHRLAFGPKPPPKPRRDDRRGGGGDRRWGGPRRDDRRDDKPPPKPYDPQER